MFSEYFPAICPKISNFFVGRWRSLPTKLHQIVYIRYFKFHSNITQMFHNTLRQAWRPQHITRNLVAITHRSALHWKPVEILHVPKVRVVETVVLENGRFVPCRKQVVLTKIGEKSDIAFCPQKQGILLLGPRKSTKMTKMAVSPQQNDRLPKAPFSQP